METNDIDDKIELPEDSGKDAGHSEGYYETHKEPGEEIKPEDEVPADKTGVPIDEKPTQPADNVAVDANLEKTILQKSIIPFTVLLVGLMGFVMIYAWIIKSPNDNGIFSPVRKILYANEKVNKIFYKEVHLAPSYPKSAAVKTPRVNGDYGMDTSFKIEDWVLYVVNIDKKDTMTLSMDDIKKLPKTEIVFNFKCIEGWSQVTHWGGVRLIDFINYYKLATHSGKPIDQNNLKDLASYAGFETPDDQYYVGLDIASALHPQTLLCYEMNGQPLPYIQGAPLRLIVPVKYGVKSLKRIGVIFFSDKRPHDYWFEQGYDYDAAL